MESATKAEQTLIDFLKITDPTMTENRLMSIRLLMQDIRHESMDVHAVGNMKQVSYGEGFKDGMASKSKS